MFQHASVRFLAVLSLTLVAAPGLADTAASAGDKAPAGVVADSQWGATPKDAAATTPGAGDSLSS